MRQAYFLSRSFIFAGVLAGSFVLVPVVSTAATETVLYTFTGGADQGNPISALIFDASGNMYGTTAGIENKSQCGTVFEIAPSGAETTLHTFAGTDGCVPRGGVIMDGSGNLFGTTSGGGSYYSGTVFKLAPDGTLTTLYAFKGRSDGAMPVAGVIEDVNGNFYGTTESGGTGGEGTVFKLSSDGSETVLRAFTGKPDGGNPLAALISDQYGNLYGTTYWGGKGSCRRIVGQFGCGTAFMLDSTGNEVWLHPFDRSHPGAEPVSALTMDAKGRLYGTTLAGGSAHSGVLFRLNRKGVETVLVNFGTGDAGNSRYPDGTLVIDGSGNVFGTTEGGGDGNSGTVFEFSHGLFTTLYLFGSQYGDGALPQAGVVEDASGNLYGTTAWGGADNYGTVFKIAP